MCAIPKKLFVVGLMIICFALDYSATGAFEPNNNKVSTESQQSAVSEKPNERLWIELLIQPFHIVFGFVLGLCGTIFVDYWRKRGRVKDFREGIRTELKQVLGIVNWYTFNLDSIFNADKIRSMQELFREFDMYETLNPLGEDSGFEEFLDRDLTDIDIQQFIDVRTAHIRERTQSGVHQSFRKLKYTFLQNNISSISLLTKENQALLINILRKLEVVNEVVPRLDFCFQKSYDANVTAENHERLRTTYLQGCQFISDWSYETAKEIAHFLRQTAI
ncbi:hypothetical protein KA005_74105 [bacterium]|nr:hypothetical protein [bacterium]